MTDCRSFLRSLTIILRPILRCLLLIFLYRFCYFFLGENVWTSPVSFFGNIFFLSDVYPFKIYSVGQYFGQEDIVYYTNGFEPQFCGGFDQYPTTPHRYLDRATINVPHRFFNIFLFFIVKEFLGAKLLYKRLCLSFCLSTTIYF